MLTLKQNLAVTVLVVERKKVKEGGRSIAYSGWEVVIHRYLGNGYKPPKGFVWFHSKALDYEASEADFKMALIDPELPI